MIIDRLSLFLLITVPLLVVGVFFALIEFGLASPILHANADFVLRALWFGSALIVLTDAALRIAKGLFSRKSDYQI